jgi:hypothetical protein
MLLRIDETILSVDPEIEIQEKRHPNETSIGQLHEVLGSPLHHLQTISDVTVQEQDNLDQRGRVLSLDRDRPMARVHGEATSLLLLLSRLGLDRVVLL